MNDCVMEVVLGIGSNFGDRRKNVGRAVEWLLDLLEDVEVSSIYETPPMPSSSGKGMPVPVSGVTSDYMNCVVAGSYCGSIDELNRKLKEYETANGRDIYCRSHGLVPVDIDIVVASGEILRPRDYSASFFRIGYSQLDRVLLNPVPDSVS